MRLIHILPVLSFLLMVSCGAKKVAVNYADTYIENQVEKRLPLYSSQEEALSKDIDKFLNAHKDRVRKILPILDKLDLEKPATLEEQWPKFSEAYLEIAADFSKILAKHMSVFDKKQKKDFLKKLKEENNAILARDKDERKKKVEERVRSLLGTLTDQQKKILKSKASVFDEQVVTRMERRSKLHTDFKSILEQEISASAKEKMIYDAFVAYQKEALSSTKNLEIAKEVIPTLTPIQKENVRAKIAELEEILEYFLQTTY